MSDTTDYQSMFRQMLARSVQAALADIDPAAPRLEEVQRDRSLYALSLALDLARDVAFSERIDAGHRPFHGNSRVSP